MRLFKKRLTEPVRPNVEEEFYAMNMNGVLRIVEREMGDGDVVYVVQGRANASMAWEDQHDPGFDTLNAAARDRNSRVSDQLARRVVGEKVVG